MDWMKKLLLIALLLLVSGSSMAALLNVNSNYRVTQVQADLRTFGIALMEDNPDETQNDVYFGGDTRCYNEIRFSNGTRKEIPVTIEKFFKILKKGDQVRVKGGRDWDGSIHAYEVYLQTFK
jgi:hypothetical protein